MILSAAPIVLWLCDQPGINANVKAKRDEHTPLHDAILAEKFHLVDILIKAKGIDLNSVSYH